MIITSFSSFHLTRTLLYPFSSLLLSFPFSFPSILFLSLPCVIMLYALCSMLFMLCYSPLFPPPLLTSTNSPTPSHYNSPPKKVPTSTLFPSTPLLMFSFFHVKLDHQPWFRFNWAGLDCIYLGMIGLHYIELDWAGLISRVYVDIPLYFLLNKREWQSHIIIYLSINELMLFYCHLSSINRSR